MRNRWTSKIESILRRIWLFEPHSHLSPLIKWIPFSNLVTERFLCVATIKEITWGGVWKAKIGGGLTTTYLTSTRSLQKYHNNISGEKNIWHQTHKPLPNILADHIYDTFEVMKYKHQMMFMNWPQNSCSVIS